VKLVTVKKLRSLPTVEHLNAKAASNYSEVIDPLLSNLTVYWTLWVEILIAFSALIPNFSQDYLTFFISA
jgi:hypothetical protein